MKKLIDFSKFQGEILKRNSMYKIKGGDDGNQQEERSTDQDDGKVPSYAYLELTNGTCIEQIVD